jgi:putative PIN family toxin of toxin-antitoxin system
MFVVVDTNVFVSSVLNPNGTPSNVFRLFTANRFDLLATEEILAEYEHALSYKKFIPRYEEEMRDIPILLARLSAGSRLVTVDRSILAVSADVDDNKFVECAVAGGADFIVSGDKHLLELGSYEGIQIVTPPMFVDYLERGLD